MSHHLVRRSVEALFAFLPAAFAAVRPRALQAGSRRLPRGWEKLARHAEAMHPSGRATVVRAFAGGMRLDQLSRLSLQNGRDGSKYVAALFGDWEASGQNWMVTHERIYRGGPVERGTGPVIHLPEGPPRR